MSNDEMNRIKMLFRERFCVIFTALLKHFKSAAKVIQNVFQSCYFADSDAHRRTGSVGREDSVGRCDRSHQDVEAIRRTGWLH